MFNQYQPNLENMQQYLNQESERSSGEGPNWWSIPAGMSSIRILPPWDPTGRVALPVYMHPIEYKGEGMTYTKYNWTCVNRTFNKSCPICEGLAGMAAAGVDISNWDSTRRQFYFNAIVMHDPTYDNKGKGTAPGTHVLMKAPKTFYDWIISQITNPMIGDITSVTNGIDVYVTKEGTGLGTSYNMTLSPNGRTPIPQEYLDKIKDLYNLDDVFSVGFDQKQIDDLVNHLKKSAGVMAGGVNNAVNQMAGYQVPQSAPQMMPPAAAQFGAPAPNPMAPSQFTPNPVNVAPAAPNQFSVPTGIPMQSASQMPIAPVTPNQVSDNLPKCYGNYDSGNVNCVVCPHEVDCSKSK